MLSDKGWYSKRESSPFTCNEEGYPVLPLFILRICVADETSQWSWFNGSSRCGSTLQFSCFLLHAEVCDRNPIGCQLDKAVVDGIDDDRHWMR